MQSTPSHRIENITNKLAEQEIKTLTSSKQATIKEKTINNQKQKIMQPKKLQENKER